LAQIVSARSSPVAMQGMFVTSFKRLGAVAGVVAATRLPSKCTYADTGDASLSQLRAQDFHLESHNHGKTRVRVLKVRRGAQHAVSEYSVQIRLFSPDYAKVFTHEDNTGLVATDTQKNTVYVVAKRTSASTPEQFGIDLATHFLKEYPVLTAVETEVQEAPWMRASIDGSPHDHSFLRTSPERAIATVWVSRDDIKRPQVTSSLIGMTILKTTQSGFSDYLKDKYTLLPDTSERCLSTELSAQWRYVPQDDALSCDYAAVRESVRKNIIYGLFGPAAGGVFSASVQATIYDAGCLVLTATPEVEKIQINTPNIHYLPFHSLKALGSKFENDIFVPTSEPSGTIQCVVSRNDSSSGSSVSAAGAVDVKVIKEEIRAALINQKAIACPMAARLAWHAAGTYSQCDGTGGSCGATMRFEPEISDPANKGLGIIRDLLLPIKKRHPEISYSDLWALAGCAAIEFLGGPSIPVALGRVDASDSSACPTVGRLPDAHQGAEHLREVFGRMGFNDREIVALSGAHTLGRGHKVRSGFDGPWTHHPLKFDNSYFKNLMHLQWQKRVWDGEEQYEDLSGELMMLPTDMALKTDIEFAKYAWMYAQDQDVFFRDFAQAFSKLMHLGCSNKPSGLAGESRAATRSAPTCSRLTSNEASDHFREHAMHGSLERMKSYAPKADFNSVDKGSGRSALHKAAFWGHMHVVKYLIEECNVNPNLQDVEGDTALHDAARFGHLDIVKYLVPRTNLTLKNKEGLDACAIGVQMDKDDVVDVFKDGDTKAAVTKAKKQR